ncbi:MAG TPA: isoprenylcysteine carboxylmethyltransferase family protein [Gemmatimonadales bacterium]|nr:isoprenylcysteine carboxylmethyltransferase family protein [Gemmatimonadales bacterium]
MIPIQAMMWLWVLWLVSWWGAAFWSDRAVKGPGAGPQVAYNLLTVAGGVLLFAVDSRDTILRLPPAARWGTLGLAVAGFLFAWWARITLGRFWARNVSRKADHRVIENGPYALVRHPIYTGIITATVATALLKATWIAWAGVVVMTIGWYVKARLEERFLHGELGEAYDAYQRRVPMLVPFI